MNTEKAIKNIKLALVALMFTPVSDDDFCLRKLGELNDFEKEIYVNLREALKALTEK